jgi:hypothetical protein
MTSLSNGTRVRIRDTYLDEAMTEPLLGTIEDVFWRPDWQAFAFVVMFDHGDDRLSPGGEFSGNRLAPA